MQHSVTELPFNRLVGVQAATEPEGLLELPAGEQYFNHLGTVHAGAQLALAEASTGEFLLRYFGTESGLVPVVRRVEAKFGKPAQGKVTSTIRTPLQILVDAKAEVASKGRNIVSIEVELHDAAQQHTLSATFDWFLTKAQAE